MLLMCFPLLKNIEFVLRLWLGQVPEYVVGFAVLTLLESLVRSLSSPLLYGVLATGRIKIYEIALSVTYTMTLPLSYAALWAGYPMISVYCIALLSTVIVLAILLWQSSRTFELSCREFAAKVFLRVGMVALVSGVVTYLERIHTTFPFLDFITESLISVCVTFTAILFLGMERRERKALLAFVRSKITH